MQLERGRHRRWEAARANWKTLRSAHSIELYAQRLAGPEFAEPHARLKLFKQLAALQAGAARRLAAHLQTAPALAPPALGAAAVGAWRGEAERLCAEWERGVADSLAALQQCEADVDAAAEEACSQLRVEVVGYGGYSPEEVEGLMDARARPAAEARKAAAAALLQHASAFSTRSAAEWRAAAEAVGGWLGRVVDLFEGHKRQVQLGDAGVRAALRCDEFDLVND